MGAGLAIGLTTLLLVTAISPLFAGSLTASSYEAVLYGNGTLSEQYTYNVERGGEYRGLYRIWEAPLTLNTSTQPYIQLVSITPAPGTIGYVKDSSGAVAVYGPSATESSRYRIVNLAENNSVGIYNPSYYNAGKHSSVQVHH